MTDKQFNSFVDWLYVLVSASILASAIFQTVSIFAVTYLISIILYFSADIHHHRTKYKKRNNLRRK